jgi:hypothetical protein
MLRMLLFAATVENHTPTIAIVNVIAITVIWTTVILVAIVGIVIGGEVRVVIVQRLGRISLLLAGVLQHVFLDIIDHL